MENVRIYDAARTRRGMAVFPNKRELAQKKALESLRGLTERLKREEKVRELLKRLSAELEETMNCLECGGVGKTWDKEHKLFHICGCDNGRVPRKWQEFDLIRADVEALVQVLTDHFNFKDSLSRQWAAEREQMRKDSEYRWEHRNDHQ